LENVQIQASESDCCEIEFDGWKGTNNAGRDGADFGLRLQSCDLDLKTRPLLQSLIMFASHQRASHPAREPQMPTTDDFLLVNEAAKLLHTHRNRRPLPSGHGAETAPAVGYTLL